MKSRLKDVQRRDLGTFGRQIRKGFPGELSKANPEIAEAMTIKTLAGVRSGEMGKVKDELKAMLPILTSSEVRRLLYFFGIKNISSLSKRLFFFPTRFFRFTYKHIE